MPVAAPLSMIEQILRGLAGTTALIGVCCLLSRNRHAIPWRLVAGGLLLQGILAFLILATPFSGLILALRLDYLFLLPRLVCHYHRHHSGCYYHCCQ